MPVFEYKCPQCNKKVDQMMDYEMSTYLKVKCKKCQVYMNRQFPLPAKGIVKGFNDKNNYGLKETK